MAKDWEPFRKKPCQIWAYQTDKAMEVETLNGIVKVEKGEWIIKGIKGELYPCKPDIFRTTYEYIGCKDPAEGFYED